MLSVLLHNVLVLLGQQHSGHLHLQCALSLGVDVLQIVFLVLVFIDFRAFEDTDKVADFSRGVHLLFLILLGSVRPRGFNRVLSVVTLG